MLNGVKPLHIKCEPQKLHKRHWSSALQTNLTCKLHQLMHTNGCWTCHTKAVNMSSTSKLEEHMGELVRSGGRFQLWEYAAVMIWYAHVWRLKQKKALSYFHFCLLSLETNNSPAISLCNRAGCKPTLHWRHKSLETATYLLKLYLLKAIDFRLELEDKFHFSVRLECLRLPTHITMYLYVCIL